MVRLTFGNLCILDKQMLLNSTRWDACTPHRLLRLGEHNYTHIMPSIMPSGSCEQVCDNLVFPHSCRSRLWLIGCVKPQALGVGLLENTFSGTLTFELYY